MNAQFRRNTSSQHSPILPQPEPNKPTSTFQRQLQLLSELWLRDVPSEARTTVNSQGLHNVGMSMKTLLNVHLDEYIALVSDLFAQFSSSEPEKASRTLDNILAKDQALQDVLATLHSHQQNQAQIDELKKEIAEADRKIIDFAFQLGEMEQYLYEASHSSDALKGIDGTTTQQAFTADELLVLAEKLGVMSAAPDVSDKAYPLPPHPRDNLIIHSLLKSDIEELARSTIPESEREEKTDESMSEDPAKRVKMQSPAFTSPTTSLHEIAQSRKEANLTKSHPKGIEPPSFGFDLNPDLNDEEVSSEEESVHLSDDDDL